MTRFAPALILTLFLGALPGMAQVPRIVVSPVSCLPADGNGVVHAGVMPEVDDRSVRLYFRRQGFGDFYWVPMVADEGRYWGVLPVPEEANEQAEYYVAVYDGGDRILGQSPVRSAPVTGDCEPNLTPEQRDRASALTIGETSLSQKHRKVAWWECEGVVERIDLFLELRDDTSCQPIGWWERPEMLVPVGLAGVGVTRTVIVDEEPPGPEVSPAFP
ncbi:MAG: hypothetical protein R3234_03835 [Thermoanaerobaculia bacterium]|nr:hypothetical protein [Thermoanaerobaculia bacterium]